MIFGAIVKRTIRKFYFAKFKSCYAKTNAAATLIDVIDKELIARLQNNDKDAFNALYWKYHTALFFNVLKLTRDVVFAEDIVQEVFVTLWEKRSQVDSDKGIAGWLFVVSYNKSITHLKQQLKESLAEKGFEETVEQMSEADDDLLNTQVLALEQAIEHLSPQKRRVFELCKLQRKTYQEAAEEMKLSKHTVKEYLAGAIISIKEFIRQHPEYSAIFFGGCLFQNLVF